MHVKRWGDESRFSGEKFQKVNLFDSERMFCDIYCFEPGQEQALHSHADNDKIYHVIEGQAARRVGAVGEVDDAPRPGSRGEGRDNTAPSSAP